MSKIVEPEFLLLEDGLIIGQNEIKDLQKFSTPKVNQFLDNGNSQISSLDREEILNEQIRQYLSTSSSINIEDFVGNEIKDLPKFSTPKVNQFLDNSNSQISSIDREEILKEQIRQYLSTSSPIDINDLSDLVSLPAPIQDRENQMSREEKLEAIKRAMENETKEALEKALESSKNNQTTPTIAKDNSKLINIALLGAVGFLVYKLLK